MRPTVVSWAEIVERLVAPRSYWLFTVGVDGAPHAAPVWGAVVGLTLYVYTERASVKARNLAREPRALVHLESAEDVVIVHGQLRDLGHPATYTEVMKAFEAKYSRGADLPYLPRHNPDFDVLYGLHPQRAQLWVLNAYETTQQRWRSP